MCETAGGLSDSSIASRFCLSGKTALITGAGAGIGEGIASAMAEAGATVVLMGRKRDPLEALAHQIEAAGQPRAIVCPTDVRDTCAVQDIVASLDGLDIVVNNAGVNIPEKFIDVTEAHLDEIVSLNVRATFLVSQASVRKMLECPNRVDRGGVVINISSQMGHVGAPNRTVYCMSKHAIEGLTKAMAVELAGYNIRVNSICPTFVDTPLIRRIIKTDEQREALVSRIPLGNMAEVADIAGAAVFLASSAAKMITGASLAVDGGWTAQ